jgi:dCMP deaminase
VTDDRPSWDEVWLTTASTVGRRSRCVRGNVGCVLVSPDNRALSVTYVGPPKNYEPSDNDNACDKWCPRGAGKSAPGAAYDECNSIHAEANGIARVNSSELIGGTAYVSSVCCFNCAKLLAAGQVKRVVTFLRENEIHRKPSNAVAYLLDSGIEVELWFDDGINQSSYDIYRNEDALHACVDLEHYAKYGAGVTRRP